MDCNRDVPPMITESDWFKHEKTLSQIRQRLGKIFSSPYVGQWLVRSTLWCSTTSEDAKVLTDNYATSKDRVLCTKPSNQHISFAVSRGVFPLSSTAFFAVPHRHASLLRRVHAELTHQTARHGHSQESCRLALEAGAPGGPEASPRP